MMENVTARATAAALRSRVVRSAPAPMVRVVRWRWDVWEVARLCLRTEVRRFPAHTVRNIVYRRTGVALPRTSSIHWRAKFCPPQRVVVGEHTTIGDSVFLGGRDGLTTGSDVNIGSRVTIWTRQHDPDDPWFAETGGR